MREFLITHGHLVLRDVALKRVWWKDKEIGPTAAVNADLRPWTIEGAPEGVDGR